MIRRPSGAGLIFLLVPSLLLADMNLTISGDAQEKAPLETLAATPDLPKLSDLSISLDGGKAALESELSPLSLSKAALMLDPAPIPNAGFSLIPRSPYVLQIVPENLEMPDGENPEWEFLVIDESHRVWNRQSGTGKPPQILSWDGRSPAGFILNPNRIYNSVITIRTPRAEKTLPGEAGRFVALARQEGNDQVVLFSDRVYRRDEAVFSAESKIFMDDLVRRLSLQGQSGQAGSGLTWSVFVYEPDPETELARARLSLWKKKMAKDLGISTAIDSVVVLSPSPTKESFVAVVLRGYKDPPEEQLMWGTPRLARSPAEKTEGWVSVREIKSVVFVDMQHDRLFLPTSAYLRDEALPLLADTLARVRAIRTEDETLEPRKRRKVVLRSYAERPNDPRRNKVEEDPRLAALRTKVLFTLFVKEDLLP